MLYNLFNNLKNPQKEEAFDIFLIMDKLNLSSKLYQKYSKVYEKIFKVI